MVIACAFLMLLVLSPPELETRCHFQEVWEETRPCCVYNSYNLNFTTFSNNGSFSDDDSFLSCEELQAWILSNNESDSLANQSAQRPMGCYLTKFCRTQETLWTENENIQRSVVQNCDQSPCECNLPQACRTSETLARTTNSHVMRVCRQWVYPLGYLECHMCQYQVMTYTMDSDSLVRRVERNCIAGNCGSVTLPRDVYCHVEARTGMARFHHDPFY